MRRNSSAFALAAASLVCILLVAACNNSGGLRLQFLTISPSGTTTISATTTQQFTATGYSSNGSIQPVSASWNSSAPAVATIDNNGVATAIAPGTTTITASSAGVAAPGVTLAVNQLLSITVTPATVTIAATQTQQYTAMGTFKNPDGSTAAPIDITSLVDSANGWNSSNTGVATVDNTGLATAVANGSTMITATLYGVTSAPPANLTVGGVVAVSLVVSPATPTFAVGNILTFTVQEKLSDGSLRNPPAGAVITWSSDTPASAAILANSGIAAGFAPGTPKITANETSPATLTGSTTLTVVAGTAHYAYVANNGDNDIEWNNVTAGASPYVSPAVGNVVIGGAIQSFLHPNGQYLYALDTLSDIFLYNVNPSDGSFAFPAAYPATLGEPQAKAGTGSSGVYGAIDPYGRFLYVSNQADNAIYGYVINPDGSFATSGTPPVVTVTSTTTNVSNPQIILFDHSGSYLYVVNQGNETVSAYTIDQTSGALTALTGGPTIATGTGSLPQYATFDPSGTHLYVADNGNNMVSVYTVGADGVLTELTNSPYAVTGGVSVYSAAVDPAGKFLYVLDAGTTGNGQVFSYTIGAGGAIVTPEVSSVLIGSATGPFSNSIAIDPTGTLLAITNNFDNTISPVSVSSTGGLTAQADQPIGNSPGFLNFYNAP